MTLHHSPVADALLRSAGVRDGSNLGGWTTPHLIPPKETGMTEDPWKHRSKGMQCRTCMWYVEKVPTVEGPVSSDPKPGFGRCRRHAPTMNGYPAVFATDWCGDHKVDENKL